MAENMPIGVGSYVHYDRKLDGRIEQGVVSINAFKGVSFGFEFKFVWCWLLKIMKKEQDFVEWEFWFWVWRQREEEVVVFSEDGIGLGWEWKGEARTWVSEIEGWHEDKWYIR